ncbi:GNAT family N-acetyltransferase [Roseofilum sp. BLCC_M91]|uniref:GNAT family N-acetyltransferase n=1 Tax=Roseofilum halophilum BLCC-M91 TaxID=3022259 RepID=A0ABT7BGY4_9CYAN|nr:GNAT family N-acetyltransferase [Roseofilum halophilum]MDJ1178441.1 GNAT family N-acetyltransferase [Roseofilum halophilum BLCC-M91]
MIYTCHLATQEDTAKIAPLMAAFSQERAAIDPTRTLKPDFDFEGYISDRINKPLHYFWLLEHTEPKLPNYSAIVGYLFVYAQDEAPPPDLPADLVHRHHEARMYEPRRVGTALAFYIHPRHRKPKAIKQLIEAGIQQAKEWKITDLDVQVGADRQGLQALLERCGFTRTAVQYTCHFNLSPDEELPSLHPPHPQQHPIAIPEFDALPLRDPHTQELVMNAEGKPVFLKPLRNEAGEVLKTSQGLPVYPTPVQDPQTQAWVFDRSGELLTCPVLRDRQGQVVEYQGIPQYRPPVYHISQGQVTLKQDGEGRYLFCEPEQDPQGHIIFDPNGKPVYKPATVASQLPSMLPLNHS